ncbi:uncharacterized protein LOC120930315 [Rana temporaria]|uniref:uncharacterized protein LOC120930315 n=1 Tax=Rana temporaria TaxID=8407 RepID=UPI001AAC904E|nr:uncharacterized protein LOC120930315 [Rana temporaria]
MQNSSRPTTSNVSPVPAASSNTQPSSPISPTHENPQSPNADAPECLEEESFPTEVEPASRVATEARGRGGLRGRGRGRGRQPRGGSDDPLLSLLQQVREERRSVDAFLDPSNPRSTFCRSLYPILDDIGGDQEKTCMSFIYTVANEFREAKLSGGPTPKFKLINLNAPPTAPATSAVQQSPYYPIPPIPARPTTSYSQMMSQPYEDFTPATSSHFPSPYSAPRYHHESWNERQPQSRPKSPHAHGDQVSTPTYHQLG